MWYSRSTGWSRAGVLFWLGVFPEGTGMEADCPRYDREVCACCRSSTCLHKLINGHCVTITGSLPSLPWDTSHDGLMDFGDISYSHSCHAFWWPGLDIISVLPFFNTGWEDSWAQANDRIGILAVVQIMDFRFVKRRSVRGFDSRRRPDDIRELSTNSRVSRQGLCEFHDMRNSTETLMWENRSIFQLWAWVDIRPAMIEKKHQISDTEFHQARTRVSKVLCKLTCSEIFVSGSWKFHFDTSALPVSKTTILRLLWDVFCGKFGHTLGPFTRFALASTVFDLWWGRPNLLSIIKYFRLSYDSVGHGEAWEDPQLERAEYSTSIMGTVSVLVFWRKVRKEERLGEVRKAGTEKAHLVPE